LLDYDWFTYDWFTNEEKDRIWLDGTYKINDPNWNDLFKTSKFREVTIFSEMFLLDQNYKIIGTNKFVISFAVGLGYTVRNHKFKKDFPYKIEYKYVTYKMTTNATLR
jgi:hypothetical protein